MAPLPSRMTAIAIRSPGAPDVLVPEERPVPAPGAGEILVKIAAAGVNRPDVRQRQGNYPPPKGTTDIPGLEVPSLENLASWIWVRLAAAMPSLTKVIVTRGYQGQVVVCMITYEPVAGHRPERSAIKHLTQTREMEIALAPIAGTRVLAPFRVSLPTLLGPAVLQAVQFATLPPGPRPTSVKTQ